MDQDIAPSASHLAELVTLHKGNVSDVVSQLRSLNRTIESTMVTVRDSAKQSQAWVSGITQTVESSPTIANDQDVRTLIVPQIARIGIRE